MRRTIILARSIPLGFIIGYLVIVSEWAVKCFVEFRPHYAFRWPLFTKPVSPVLTMRILSAVEWVAYCLRAPVSVDCDHKYQLRPLCLQQWNCSAVTPMAGPRRMAPRLWSVYSFIHSFIYSIIHWRIIALNLTLNPADSRANTTALVQCR